MTADILDFADWSARLRAETQPAPEPERLPLAIRGAIRLAGIAFEGACRTAARLNRQGRHADALAELDRCYTDMLELARACPHVQITGMLQSLHAKAAQLRKQVKARAKR